MKKILFTWLFVVFCINIYSESTSFSYDDLFGRWYYINGGADYINELSHDVSLYVCIQKNGNNVNVYFTQGLNYDFSEAINVSLTKENNKYWFILKKEMNKKVYQIEYFIEPYYYEYTKNWMIRLYYENAIETDNIYVKQTTITSRYIDTNNEPNYKIRCIVNSDKVRLRKLPNLKSEILDIVNSGTNLVIVYRTKDSEIIDGIKDYWYKVILKTENKKGWIWGGYLSIMQNMLEE
jgi:hypothetical protein